MNVLVTGGSGYIGSHTVVELMNAGHEAIIVNVAQTIQKKAELIAPLEEGIRGLELGNAMLLSGWRDSDITLPMDGEDFENRLNQLIATSRYRKKSAEKAE